MVKGTERVISSEPLYKDDIASFPTVPLKPFSDQYWERYCRVSNVFNSDNFYVFLQKNYASHFCYRNHISKL